jgi:hypothetical protein
LKAFSQTAVKTHFGGFFYAKNIAAQAGFSAYIALLMLGILLCFYNLHP